VNHNRTAVPISLTVEHVCVCLCVGWGEFTVVCIARL